MDGRFKQPLLNIEITYKTTENTQETIPNQALYGSRAWQMHLP
jgi:hypothetical protein